MPVALIVLALSVHGGTVRPKHEQYLITSSYGERIGPISGKPDFHHGIDLSAKYNNGALRPVENIWKGTVIFAGWQNNVIPKDFSLDEPYIEHGGIGFGQYVKVLLPSGMIAIYAHLSQINVELGQEVEIGDIIGWPGQNGIASSTHLHLELRRPNGETVDPMNYIPRNAFKKAN